MFVMFSMPGNSLVQCSIFWHFIFLMPGLVDFVTHDHYDLSVKRFTLQGALKNSDWIDSLKEFIANGSQHIFIYCFQRMLETLNDFQASVF